MAANTKISWATHTLNWWTGCEAISPACAGCYAAAWAKRAGRDFAERRLTTEANRRQALKWARNADAFFAEHGHRQRVFVNSLSDWADNRVPQEWRDSLFDMIRATPDLDYLLLTKRIGNAARMLPSDWGTGYPNVWMLATVANQEEADRDIDKLLRIPAVVRGLSIEPMLGPVDLSAWLPIECVYLSGNPWRRRTKFGEPDSGISWLISGGESGPKARPSHPDWFRSLRDQCAAAGVAFFMKQMGGTRDKRDALESIPEDLRLRSWPQ